MTKDEEKTIARARAARALAERRAWTWSSSDVALISPLLSIVARLRRENEELRRQLAELKQKKAA